MEGCTLQGAGQRESCSQWTAQSHVLVLMLPGWWLSRALQIWLRDQYVGVPQQAILACEIIVQVQKCSETEMGRVSLWSPGV